MPNYCANMLVVSGDPEEVARFRGQAMSIKAPRKDGARSEFDLSRFIPMPDEIDQTRSPNRDRETVPYLVEKYGVDNWHDWAMLHWGTKWGTDYGKATILSEGQTCFMFLTAWAPFHESAFSMISAAYPGLAMSLHFAERNMAFWGHWTAQDGQTTVEREGLLQMEYREDTDTWVYHGDFPAEIRELADLSG